MKFSFLCFLLSLTLFSSDSFSKVVLERYKDTNAMTIKIIERITETEYIEFVNAYKALKKFNIKLHLNAVQLDSNGGFAKSGMDIGWFIRHNNINTFVAPDSQCSSACVYILVGGIIRLAYGKVGVHRSTPSSKTTDIEILQERMDLIEFSTSQYFKDMGMSLQLTTAALIIPNWSIRYLTEDEKLNWGVHGIERLHEELYFRQSARKLGVDFYDYQEKFTDQLENCKMQAKKFESMYFDCVK